MSPDASLGLLGAFLVVLLAGLGIWLGGERGRRASAERRAEGEQRRAEALADAHRETLADVPPAALRGRLLRALARLRRRRAGRRTGG